MVQTTGGCTHLCFAWLIIDDAPVEGNLQVFDYLNGSHMKSFAYAEIENRAHMSEVTRVCYCAEHMSVISGSWDCCINIHDESDSERGVLLRRMVGGHSADITALRFSYNLSLVASGASDYSLQIWDYEFGRLDGTCIGHVSGILALQFLDPFPLLVSTDNSGNLCIWAMRPSRFKCKCVYRFRNQRGVNVGGGIASVNCLATYSERDPEDDASFHTYLLIAGDDKGTITVWNMLPLLLRLEQDFQLQSLEKPIECANPQRNLRVNASGMVRKVKNGPEWAAFCSRDPATTFFFPQGMPLLQDSSVVERLHQWRAHSDVVYSVEMIPEPKSLITCSFDRRVKIWTLQGECLGILMQGDMQISKRPWKFSVDYEARERKKESSAAPVVEDVHQLIQNQYDSREQAQRRRAERREAAAAAAAGTNDSSEQSVLEDISRTYLPPILPGLRGGRLHTGSVAGAPQPLRKTPRRKPVNAVTAGRSLVVVSPRHLKLINRVSSSQ